MRPEASKSSRNAMGNAINPYQGDSKKVLCVCSAGILRSPTTANILHAQYGYNTRACGIESAYALIHVSEALLVWADEIVCMNREQKITLQHMIDGLPCDNSALKDRIQVLTLPDEYGYMDKTLQRLIIDKYEVDKYELPNVEDESSV